MLSPHLQGSARNSHKRACHLRPSHYVFSCGNEDIGEAAFIPIIKRAQVVKWLHTRLCFSIILRTPPTVTSAPLTVSLAPHDLSGTPCKSECEAEEGLHQGPAVQHQELYSIFYSNYKGKESEKLPIYTHAVQSLSRVQLFATP